MANVKISELNPLVTVQDADVLPIVDNAITKKVTAAILRTYTQGNSVLLTGAQTIAGIKTFTAQLASSVATGTAPFSVASTTKVTNLNADLLDGLSSADFALSTTTLTAGTGLTGGGDLTANRTFAIDGTVTTLTGAQTLTNKTLTSPVINEVLDSNGNEILGFTPIASATDYITIKNGIGVGVPVHIIATGSSANVGLHLEPKGTGLVQISDGTDTTKGIRFRSSSSAAAAITLIDAVSSAGRVITLPNATTTLVGTNTTDTLTNKSIAGDTNTLSNIGNASLTNSAITINGTSTSLGGSISVGTVTSVAALTLGTSGTDLTSTVATGTTTPVITLNVPTASASNRGALSSTDWTTFNAKQTAGNYITALTGEASASGPGSSSITLTNSAVIGKVLTGLNVTGGSVSATDSILDAFGKVQNQINSLVGGTIYKGTWDASTNTPTLVSSVGTQGYYYIVSVAGSTNLNGITSWNVGDWAIFDGTAWQKVDNTDSVVSVNGLVGAVSLTTSNITEGTNLYYTEARVDANSNVAANTAARHNAVTLGTANGLSLSTQALSLALASGSTTGALSSTDWTTFNGKQNTITLTTTGTSGAATLVGSTLNIPNYADTDTGITSLNGLTALTQTFAVGTSGTDFGISSATSTHTFNLPTASAVNRGALSSADWTTFNNKQNALTNPITGTGTTNYLPKFTGASALGNSIVSDNGTRVTIDGDFRVALADANINLQATSKSYLLQVVDSDNRFRIYDNTANAERFTISSTGAATFTQKVQVTGSTAPASGSGLELFYDGSYAGILGYNRTTPAYLPIAIDGSSVTLFTGSTPRLTVKSTGVINIANIPTSAVGLSAGDIYSNLGVLTIV
jgi:hypothetical protein